MTVIEIPDDQATALRAKAAAEGLTLKAWLGKLAGEAPTAEEIDENRKDMFRGFGENY